ncbi:MAG TPA: BREX system ATP-binding domain-containing protein [Polyangiaceae bacterium]
MAGAEIAGVELLEELGRGAHGTVYRGRRGQQFYAVKVAITPGDPVEFVRFQREAIALARARHPGLPVVLDVARSGTPYLVMELVDGETLATRLKRGPLIEADVIELGLQLADVLAHVHAVGLVHRDVKPRNIVFERATGQVRLVDFGIALGPAETEGGAGGEGTVPYAAPEQLAADPVDGRADLYALGCVLYECLGGELPLPGSELPLAPDAGGSTARRPRLSRELGTLLKKLLAANPRERYPRAEDLAAALAEIQDAEEPSKRSDRPRFTVPPDEALSVKLVGREPELSVLWQELKVATESGSRALFVEGALGSGKTALLRTFAHQAKRRGHTALFVSCLENDPAPFGVIGRLLAACLDLAGRSKFAEAARGFESILGVLSPSLAHLFPEARPLLDSEAAHNIFLEGASRVLARMLQAAGPALICVDDVHFIDAASAAILRKLLATFDAGDELLLLACRPDEGESRELDALRSRAHHDRIPVLQLRSLSRQSIALIAANYLGVERLADSIVDRVAALASPTPLGVLEVMRTFLDERALLPHWDGWRIEADAADAVRLPESVVEVLKARIARLDADVSAVLVAAAALGREFDLPLVALTAGRSESDVSTALAEARRADLVSGGPTEYRLVHHAVRDALLASQPASLLKNLHQHAAAGLERRLAEGSSRDPSLVYRVADLYFRGEWRREPEKTLLALELAARHAFDAFDNRRALTLVEQAEQVRDALQQEPSGRALHVHGEVLIRLGSNARGRTLLERALERTPDRLVRGEILALIAWTYETELDSEAAWHALARAFHEVGENFPDTTLRSFGKSAGAWVRNSLESRERESAPGERRRLEIVSILYYRVFRLGLLGGEIARIVQAGTRGYDIARKLGPGPELARSSAVYGFMLSGLSRGKGGERYLRQAEEIATASRNPVTVAHIQQMNAVIASWLGDFDRALEIGSRCLLEHGHWQEFSEHCLLAHSQELLECVRGRGQEELFWLDHILARLELTPEANGLWEMILLHAEALLVHLGRGAQSEPRLAKLRAVTFQIPKSSACYVLTFGPRVRAVVECGDYGPRFDAIEAEFRQGGHDPKRVHLAVAEYYLHAAHGHVHASLRAADRDRPREIDRLKRAAAELRAAARIPVLKAHSLVVDAYVAHFSGEAERAARLFAEADALGLEEESPWVRYAAARGRAHSWKGRKHADVIQAEARIAEEIAREHGAAHRLRWIREEFAIPAASITFSSRIARRLGETPATGSRKDRRTHTTRRLMRAAVPAGRAEGQRQLLDELVHGLDVREAHLFWVDDEHRARWVCGRDASGRDAQQPSDCSTRLVQSVAVQELAAFVDDADRLRSCVAAPLIARGRVRGAVCLESDGCGVFGMDDAELLSALGTKLLPEDPGAESGARVEAAADQAELAIALAEDLERILDSEANSESDSLTRVLAFARGLRETKRLEQHRPGIANLNDIVLRAGQRLMPALGANVELLTSLEAGLDPVEVDAEHLEILVLHCALGASRRMQPEGTLVIETANVSLDRLFSHRFPQANCGAYAMLSVSVVPDSRAPKPERPAGFGAFAEQVYRRAVKKNGGQLALDPVPTAGTSLQILFPRLGAARVSAEDAAATLNGRHTILIVEPDDRLRKVTSEELKELGHRVLATDSLSGGASIARMHGSSIDLTVVEPALYSDPMCPSPTATLPSRATIYASAVPWNALRAAGIVRPKAQFLQKPYSLNALIGRLNTTFLQARELDPRGADS